ncbi:hypothetical protein LCGC14_1408420 [marine sediment metagenome]|uniref:Uncharacterized protein n=1 Tax=marine sediment metagenome TaxID=412755 RepID=A0A0F9MWL4_9ZZZZ
MDKELQEAKKEAVERRVERSEKERITNNMEKKKKDTKVFYKADFDDLIDIVLNDDHIKFLTSDQELRDDVTIDGVVYQPPPQTGLPPNLQIPRSDKVLAYARNHDKSGGTGVSGACRGCTLLYKKLLDYHTNISELPDKDLYHLLVIWDFHTYLIEKANFSPMIYFYSIAERGKSRTLKGMVNVAFRGIRKGDITDAQLIRDCTHLRATIAFDMMDFWEKIKNAGSVDVILNRYERGMTVSRVNRPDRGAFQDTDYYDVFGPTVLATNEIISTIADTRAIPIVMIKSDKDFEEEVSPKKALPLKEELTAFRLAHYNDPFPSVPKIVKSRLGDITKPLYQILSLIYPISKEEYTNIINNTTPIVKTEVRLSTHSTFINLIRKIEKTKLVEKIGSIDSDIIQAWVDVKGESIGGVLACQLVTTEFNAEKDEREKLSSRRVGNRLKSYGFQPTTTSNHTLGFFLNDEVLQKLIKEYDLPIDTPSQTPDSPENPESPEDEADPDKLPF